MTGQHLEETSGPITFWRETAAAVAAGPGSEPLEWLDNADAVERPLTSGEGV
jgi:hypothetical protein